MCFLVISIFLYACESWTLTAELEKRTQAFEMRCYRSISFKDHVTNKEVRRKIQAAIGEYDELLILVKKRKLRWFDHVSRSSDLTKALSHVCAVNTQSNLCVCPNWSKSRTLKCI